MKILIAGLAKTGTVEPMLRAHGYDANDWNTNADPVIAPAHCSEYIARLAADARRRDFPLRGFA